MPYDKDADAHLKKIGNQLISMFVNCILQRPGSDSWAANAAATAIATSIAGFLPIGDGPNSKTDAEIAAAISRVERVLGVIAENARDK